MENPKIQIYVACHKPSYVLNNQLLIPVQVGTALVSERYEGMCYDNDGENISEKNLQYCELTAQYWAWKNAQNDFYGFFHYRRYLCFSNIYRVLPNGELEKRKRVSPYIELEDVRQDLSQYGLGLNVLGSEITEYDLVTVLREKINTTVYRQYCQYHQKDSLDRILNILLEKYPQYQMAAAKYMNSKEIYYLNMYVMRRSVFHEYMKWLFNILEEFEKDSNELGVQLENRSMGYLAERLFGIFYTYQREHGIKCAEVQYLKFYNTGCGSNEETQRNVREFCLKPSRVRIKIDMRKLNRLFPAGSRRRIWLRSIFVR